MARSTKLIICIILMCIIGYAIFAVSLSAYKHPAKSVVSDKSVYKNVETTDDPDLLIQKSGDYVVYHLTSSFIVYVILLAFAFAVCVSYLGFTKLCREDISKVFNENGGTIIAFLCSSLSVMFFIEYILCFVVQTLILGKYM